MSRGDTTSFSDPDEYKSGFRGARIELVVASPGTFKGRLTRAELSNLQLFYGQENLSRIAHISLTPKKLFISFAMLFDPSSIYDGVELQPGDIVFHSRGERLHWRTNGPSQWGLISLSPRHFAQFYKGTTGRDLVTPTTGGVLRPPIIAVLNLRREFGKAFRATECKPTANAHGRSARPIEHDLLYALVNCLTPDNAHTRGTTRRSHASIMGRFETALATRANRQLSLPELCKAVGTPERTLRVCCAEMLGMGPSQYMRLRRLNLVRADLHRKGAAGAHIAQIAARYGFSEPGRFSVEYRSVFGETPSTTVRRSSIALRDTISAEFA